MSLPSGSSEPFGGFNLFNPGNAKGNIFAKEWINDQSDLLSNFLIDLTENDCGTQVFDYDYYYKCLEPLKNDIGLIYLGSDFVAGTLGTITIFKD